MAAIKQKSQFGTEAEKALRFVREAKTLAFDTETSGVDWKKNSPIGYVFCADSSKESLYVPIRAGGGGNLPGVPVLSSPTDKIVIHSFERDLAKAFVERQRLKYATVGHHIKFDAHMAANAGVLLGRNLVCTQNLETLLDEYVQSYGLGACALRHGVEAKKDEELYRHIANLFGCSVDRKAMAHFWRLSGNDPIAVEYAKGDGVSTFQLYESQIKKIHEQRLDTIAELESQLIWTLFRIERRGIKVNVKYLHELLELIEQRVEQARQNLPKDFNIRSPKQIQEYLEANGRTDWPTTDKNNPSFTESWLKQFSEGKNIVVVRKWTNLANTFVRPLIEGHIHSGRAHATLNQLRADDYGTPARLSCSNPNLQQIPKRDKELALLFREAFVADEGMGFYEADYSQCEPRLYAHYSKEPVLLNGYTMQPFQDVHTIVARMLGVERDPTAKRMNMGIFTGMYPKSFAEHMNWPLDKATDLWNKWHATFPAIRVFQDAAKQALLNRGYVKTLLGRKLRLESPRFAYRAVSKIIQGGSADIMKYKLLEADRMLESQKDVAHLLMSVHDSLEWQAPMTREGREASDEIIRIMSDVQGPPFNLRVPFVVDTKSGKNWAEATFGDKD